MDLFPQEVTSIENAAGEELAPESGKGSSSPRVRRWVWQGKFGPAFWTVASLISLTVNLILIASLIILGRELFAIKGLVGGQLINGLYKNFVRMDEAHIVTTIQVQDTILVQDEMPVVFDLPLSPPGSDTQRGHRAEHPPGYDHPSQPDCPG